MPKESRKRKFLRLWQEILKHDLLMLEISEESDENQQRKEEEIMDELALVEVFSKQFRYGCPFVHNSVPKSRNFLMNVLPNLDESRFRQITRVSWVTFKVVLDLIKDDELFNGPRSCKQFSVQMQLAVVLYRLGSSGEGGSICKIASLFGVSDGGAIQNMTNRIFDVILKLKYQFLYWPDATERKALVAETLHELPHCIGYVDGTEIKLAEKPIQDPESYFSRKYIYSLKAQAICDYKLRIRHLVLGYPGSVHDARIFNNCSISTRTTEMISGAEWLAGDSAYRLTSTLVTPFRSNSMEGNIDERLFFNRTFSQYRIRIEHCFGLMKERFNNLKELKIQIKDERSIKFACRWILVCGILHNIIIAQKEDNFDQIEVTSGEDDSYEDENESEHFIYATNEGEAKRRALLAMMSHSIS